MLLSPALVLLAALSSDLAVQQGGSLDAATGGAAPRHAEMRCPPSGGYIQGPFAPTAATARTIYSAVRDAVAPGWSKDQRLVVHDAGDHWEVCSVIRARGEHGRYVHLQGGGFGLQIDKCTAAVSKVGGIR